MTATAATDACPGGCHRQLRTGALACRWCWYRLPPALREVITATHGRDPDAHVEAMLAALAWYREEPVERTAVPAGPPWPRVIEGQCSWCGDPESAHEGGVREHHRIELVGGRYDDERETDEREVQRRILDVVRDLFAVLDAHGYQRTSDDAALGRAVVAVWQLVDEYEAHPGGGREEPGLYCSP